MPEASRGAAGHWRIAAGVALTCGTAVIALPASASAGGNPTESLGSAHGLEYVRATFPNVTTTQLGATVSCGPDAPATGGGGSINGKGRNARLHESYPISEDGDGWKVEGSTTNPNSPRTVASFAVCGPGVVDYESVMSAPGDGDSVGAVVPCPASTEPLSGGVSATGPDLNFPTTRPALSGSIGWFTNYVNEGENDTVSFAWAGCSAQYDPRYRNGATKKVEPGADAKAIAQCKGDQGVLGGGLSPTVPTPFGPLGILDAWTLTSRPWDSDDRRKVPDDGWLVRSHNDSVGKVKLNAYAVCMPAGIP